MRFEQRSNVALRTSTTSRDAAAPARTAAHVSTRFAACARTFVTRFTGDCSSAREQRAEGEVLEIARRQLRLSGVETGAVVQGDPAIIDLLNEVLTAELTAINQYFVDAKMCGNW